MPSPFPYGDQQQAQRREDRNYDELEQLRARNAELELQLAEVKSDLSYLSTAIGTGFLPDESDFHDKMIAQRALRAANAHGAAKRAEQAEQRIAESQRQEPFGYFCDWGDYYGEQRIHMYYGEPGGGTSNDWNEYPKVECNLPLYRSPPNLPAIIEQAVAAETDRCVRILLAQDIDPSFKNRLAEAIRERGEK